MKMNIIWATNIWRGLAESRDKGVGRSPTSLDGISNESFNYWLAHFLFEVQNQKG
jgi:hypothetical protein